MNNLEKIENGVIDLSERKKQVNEDNIRVLESVKEILTLGSTELITIHMASDYFEVGNEAVKSIIKRHEKELKQNGLYVMNGSEIKRKLVKFNMNPTNYRGYFESNGVKFANGNNTILTKRTLLNIGMLLTKSKVAKELRRRILDIVHDSENRNGNIKTIVNEIDEETKLSMDLGLAMVKGDMNLVMNLSTQIFDLKNKRIKTLTDVIENSVTISESKRIIRMCINYITPRKYNGLYGMAWNDLYRFVNYKLGINVNARKGSGLNRFTDDEIQQIEIIAKSWLNELGYELDFKLQ